MKLYIDGRPIEATQGQSLLDLVRILGLDSDVLSERPLAARIAGEVFTLNYVPVREKEEERSSLRRAMAASEGQVNLIRIQDTNGRGVYNRTVQFVLFLALRQLWPHARAKMDCIRLEVFDINIEQIKLTALCIGRICLYINQRLNRIVYDIGRHGETTLFMAIADANIGSSDMNAVICILCRGTRTRIGDGVAVEAQHHILGQGDRICQRNVLCQIIVACFVWQRGTAVPCRPAGDTGVFTVMGTDGLVTQTMIAVAGSRSCALRQNGSCDHGTQKYCQCCTEDAFHSFVHDV